MPHGWLNDTMPGRYRQREAGEAWDKILDFVDRVHAGYFAPDKVTIKFESDFAADYDFSKSVRYGTGNYPEPDVRAFNELKAKVAAGEAPQADLDRQLALYHEFFADHPELLP
jgi:hypothetical protein